MNNQQQKILMSADLFVFMLLCVFSFSFFFSTILDGTLMTQTQLKEISIFKRNEKKTTSN
jgi:hypothetical protein